MKLIKLAIYLYLILLIVLGCWSIVLINDGYRDAKAVACAIVGSACILSLTAIILVYYRLKMFSDDREIISGKSEIK